MNQCGMTRVTPRFLWHAKSSWTPKTQAAELPPGWVFGVQLGLRQTQALNKTKTIRRGKVPPASLLLSSNLLLSSKIAGGTFPLLIVFILIISCFLFECHKKHGVTRVMPHWFISNQVMSWLELHQNHAAPTQHQITDSRNYKGCEGERDFFC